MIMLCEKCRQHADDPEYVCERCRHNLRVESDQAAEIERLRLQLCEKTPNASRILESLDAAEISKRLGEIQHEQEALRVLYRAVVRLERLERRQIPEEAD